MLLVLAGLTVTIASHPDPSQPQPVSSIPTSTSIPTSFCGFDGIDYALVQCVDSRLVERGSIWLGVNTPEANVQRSTVYDKPKRASILGNIGFPKGLFGAASTPKVVLIQDSLPCYVPISNDEDISSVRPALFGFRLVS